MHNLLVDKGLFDQRRLSGLYIPQQRLLTQRLLGIDGAEIHFIKFKSELRSSAHISFLLVGLDLLCLDLLKLFPVKHLDLLKIAALDLAITGFKQRIGS